MDILSCIWNRIVDSFRSQILPAVVALIALGVVAGLLTLLITFDPQAALAAFLLSLYAALLILVIAGAFAIVSAIISCVVLAIQQGIDDLGEAAPSVGQALTAVDCPSAQAAYAQEQAAYDAALAARNVARASARRARRRANAASQFQIAALSAIAAVSWFRPDLLIAAIVASVAAAALLARGLQQLARAEAQLLLAEAALVAAAARLGAAQALVDQLCGQGEQTPIGTVDFNAAVGKLDF